MWLIERLRPLAPPILSCPADPGDYLLCRVGGEAGIPLGASLTVRDGEQAMLVSGQRIVNALTPGIHRLDRRGLADFDALYAWPQDFAGPVDASIVFVSTAGHRPIVWHFRNPAAQAKELIEVSGTIDVVVTDPQRFAAWHLARGQLDDESVRRTLERAIITSLRQILKSPASQSDGPVDTRDGVARSLRKRLRAELSSRGIGEFSIKVRRMNRTLPTDPPTATASSPSNIAHLPIDRPAAAASATGVGRVPPPPAVAGEDTVEPVRDGEGDELEAILELEREIERLDAWSSIGSQPVEARDAGTDETGETGETAASSTAPTALPERFRSLSFYIAIDMQQTGPFDVDEFEQALREGVVEARTLVWYEGMEDWRPAGEIPEVAALL